MGWVGLGRGWYDRVSVGRRSEDRRRILDIDNPDDLSPEAATNGVEEGGGSFIACLSQLAIDHASLLRRSIETPPPLGRSSRFLLYIT